MTATELRRLAENATPGPWYSRHAGDDLFIHARSVVNPIGSGGSTADARYIAAASPDVVLALLDRCEMAESLTRAHESQPFYRRMVSWTDDATGDVYGQNADDLTLAEANAYTRRNEVAIAVRNFFRDLRVFTLLDRIKALEVERDALKEHINAETLKALVLVEENRLIVDMVETIRAERDARPAISREDARAYHLRSVGSHDQPWAETWAGFERVEAALRAHAAKGGE